jgi:hypothetical protein
MPAHNAAKTLHITDAYLPLGLVDHLVLGRRWEFGRHREESPEAGRGVFVHNRNYGCTRTINTTLNFCPASPLERDKADVVMGFRLLVGK